MWLLTWFYFFNTLYSWPFSTIFTFFVFISPFLLLRSLRDTFYNLKSLIRFNHNPYSVIHTKSFLFLNSKVSQLKCISLIKLASTLNTLFPLERNFFHREKGWNKLRRQCTKSAQKGAQKVLLLCRCLCLW